MKGNFSIDWRRPYSLLEPHIEGTGGVIHVRGGENAPHRLFIDVLRFNWMPQSELFSWMNCVIDPIDGRTHYTIDLIREIARCASITLPSPRVPNTPLVNIGTDVKARSAEYSNIHINIYERRDLEQERAELDALCEGLRKLLQQKRMALVFIQTHSIEEEHGLRLYRDIWEGKLEELIEHGLLVLACYDPSKKSKCDNIFPPPPTCIVDLPEYLIGQEDCNAANDDLVRIALDNDWHSGSKEARAFADAMIYGSNSMKDLHARLAVYRAQKRQSNV